MSKQRPEGIKPEAATPRILRREAAHKWLDLMCDDAESPQVGGRPFYGKVILTIPYENGQPQDITTSKEARDRVSVGRQN